MAKRKPKALKKSGTTTLSRYQRPGNMLVTLRAKREPSKKKVANKEACRGRITSLDL